MYDVIIVGAGVTGCAVARELSRYRVKACVIEKEEDVCCGTSKANSAIVHAGFDAKTGSNMARYNLEGNALMGELAEELDFPFKRNGSLVVCLEKDSLEKLTELYERGVNNGVKNLRILGREELIRMEPNISDEALAALYAPTGGIVCPFQLTIALAENAYTNGVAFQFNTKVLHIEQEHEGYTIKTNKGICKTKMLINAAGVYGDEIHNMVSKEKITIIPRAGEYCLLDKKAGNHVHHTVFQLPGRYGKGVLVTPTVHGNLLMGPTAVDITDKEGTNTTKEGLEAVLKMAGNGVKNIPNRLMITSFAGLRAHEKRHDFIIEEVTDAPGFIDCVGIESPGLTSAPAIGRRVSEMIREYLSLSGNPDFTAARKGMISMRRLSPVEREAVMEKNPAYGAIVCRCEMISEGEIIDAIRRPLGARSLDGVKRRTRAGAGRCQSGFCSPKVMEIIAGELGMKAEEVTKCGGESKVIAGRK